MFASLIVILVIVGAIAVRNHFNTEGTAKHQAEIATKIKDAPPAYDVSALQLEGDYKLDNEAASEKYDGKVVLVTGLLKDLDRSHKSSFIAKESAPYMDFHVNTWNVQCLIPDDQYEAIRAIPGYGYQSLRLQMKGMVRGFEERLLRVRVEGCRLQQTLPL